MSLCLVVFVLCAMCIFTGCRTSSIELPNDLAASAQSPTLAEGDILQISFIGATNLNSKQRIRRDGTVDLPLIGDIKAAQKTLGELQTEVSNLYKPHLQSQDVTVSLESSAVPVYVTGAVLRPGKIVTDRQLTALEAIMEAGGFDQQRANLRKVVVVRYIDGKRVGSVIDLQGAIKGGKSSDAVLQPNDIIFVPEKLQVF